MKIQIKKSDFLKGMRVAEKAIGENKIRPILASMYMETNGSDKLILKGTNLELTVLTEVPCIVEEEGKVVFTYQLLDEYLREIKVENLTMTTGDNTIHIEIAGGSTEFATYDASEYPTLEIPNDIYFQKIAREDFITLFEKTKFASAKTSDNLSINCVRMGIDGDHIKMTATDTYRLVYLNKKLEEKYEEGRENLEVSIPLLTIEALIKIFKYFNDECVYFTFEGKKIIFKVGETIISSRIIELNFPNIQAVVESTNYTKRFELSAAEFLMVLKRVGIFVKNNQDSKNSAIFHIIGNELTIDGQSDIARINEKVMGEYQGEEIKLSLNVKYLAEFIQNIDADARLVIELLDKNSAIRVHNKADKNYLYVVMPLAY